MPIPTSYGVGKGWPVAGGQRAPSAPDAPTLTLTAGNAQLTLGLSGYNGGSPITSYTLYLSTTNGFTPGPASQYGTVTNGQVLTGLVNGTTYYAVATATNAIGTSGYSAQASGIPINFATLPALGQAYGAVRSTQVMVSGYSGNLFRLRNSANSSFVDIAPAAGSNIPSDTTLNNAITTLGGTAYFAKIYDQTGNGFDLSLPTVNSQTTAVDMTQKTPSGALWVNSADAVSGEMVSTGHSINNQNFTLFAVMQMPSCNQGGMTVWSMDDGTSTLESAISGPAGNNIRSRSAGSGYVSFASNIPQRANPIVMGWTNNGTNRRLYMNETNTTTSGAPTTGTSTRVEYFASSKIGSGPGVIRWCGDVLSVAQTTGDGTTLQGSLATIFGVPTVFDRRLLIVGDSIAQGYLQGLHHTIWEQLALTTTSNVEMYSIALTGQQMGAVSTNTALATPYITSAYGAGKMVTVVELGINDLDTGVGNQNYTTLASRANTVIPALKSAYTGGRVLQTQLLPQAGTGWNATQEGYRIQFNSDVASGTYGAHAAFLQGDTSSTMGTPATYPGGTGGSPNNSTYYNSDKLHPNQAGAALLAIGTQASPPSGFANYQAAINSLWF